MPKRTKKQKVQAATRRTHKKAPSKALDMPQPVSPTQAPVTRPSVRIMSDQPTPPSSAALPKSFLHGQKEAHHFKLDLLKSLFITIVLIGIQLGIYIADVTGTFQLSSLLNN